MGADVSEVYAVSIFKVEFYPVDEDMFLWNVARPINLPFYTLP
jgi:hypothetical protein